MRGDRRLMRELLLRRLVEAGRIPSPRHTSTEKLDGTDDTFAEPVGLEIFTAVPESGNLNLKSEDSKIGRFD